jgi:hypothetical protein
MTIIISATLPLVSTDLKSATHANNGDFNRATSSSPNERDGGDVDVDVGDKPFLALSIHRWRFGFGSAATKNIHACRSILSHILSCVPGLYGLKMTLEPSSFWSCTISKPARLSTCPPPRHPAASSAHVNIPFPPALAGYSRPPGTRKALHRPCTCTGSEGTKRWPTLTAFKKKEQISTLFGMTDRTRIIILSCY